MTNKTKWCIVLIAVALTNCWSQTNKLKPNPTLWLGIFKPMTERLNADWAVGADFRLKGSTYLALRYFRCKDEASPANGKSLAALVGFSIPLSSTEKDVNYRAGAGVGVAQVEASGQGKTHRGMLEGFIEAQTGSFGVRLGYLFDGLNATSGWFVALLRKF